jgi:plastocyanin
MARRTLVVLAVTTLGVLAAPALPAFAGGGCHTGATTGTGDTVEMRELCFTPTTLHVDPGDTVTFVNRDPTEHNVLGNGWGTFEPMVLGDAFTATFAESGVYPFACAYHPGMTGAIVVGSGEGAGGGEQVEVASYRPPAPSPAIAVQTVAAAEESTSAAVGWVGGTALGLAVGLGGGLALRRRSRRAPATG